MQTLEFILIFSALLSVLTLLAGVMDEHREQLENARDELSEKGFVLRCSARADAAVNHYAPAPSHACLNYAYALNSPHSPFALVLGGDANHYG